MIEISVVNEYLSLHLQAVFLAEHYDKLSAADQIKSERIDGVGAREYHQRSHAGFSPRALTFLERESEVLTITRG